MEDETKKAIFEGAKDVTAGVVQVALGAAGGLPVSAAISLGLKLIVAAWSAYQERRETITREDLDATEATLRAVEEKWNRIQWTPPPPEDDSPASFTPGT